MGQCTPRGANEAAAPARHARFIWKIPSQAGDPSSVAQRAVGRRDMGGARGLLVHPAGLLCLGWGSQVGAEERESAGHRVQGQG